PAYIDSILSVPNVSWLNQSKWMNQVCIKITDAAALTKINSFPFVKVSSPIAVRMAVPAWAPTTDKLEDIDGEERAGGIESPSGVQANYYNYGNNLPQVHIHQGEYLHNLGFHGENMTIAILDAGFYGYLTNPMFDSVRLNSQILGTYDYVNLKTSVNEENYHGMSCFSTIAANRPGIMTGTSPKAKFWLLKTEDVTSEYPVEEQNWAAAAEFADSAGADLISTSLGYDIFLDHSFDHLYVDRNGHTALSTRAANLAVSKGILVTASAGNDGTSANENKYILCPADGDSVLTIGATDVNGTIASFSCWGPNSSGRVKPDVVSVGYNSIVSNTVGNPVALSGTSFSNPNLAGLVT
ncbi:MAG TPA: S8 family serine peptidase, partial [Chitinophagaceae bacterium]|nr:S8 family serine peptidase [Chitinophagaceae bacterium]